MEVTECGRMLVRGCLIRDVERLPVDPDELRGERLAGPGREDRLDRPVLPGGERPDLALALDDETHGHRLHATGGQATLDLLAEERTQGVADEAADEPPGPPGVDPVHGDLARARERVPGRR